jgi:holin-like protein
MLRGLTTLLLFELIGQALSTFAALPLPGPLVGLLLLLAWLMARGGPPAELSEAASGLLRNLGLFFVPAGVGIVTQLDLIGRNWLAVSVALVVSAVLGLATTGWLMQRLARPEPPQVEP